ncbi:hypothetical protein DOY81_007427 [Sarcophaga bullata]|nr:hypothetical protein DOY81_007427 [Sarcophaga bullata]
MANYDYIAVAQRAEAEENSLENSTRLCCCEYIDNHQQRNHLLACCCNCQDFDLAFTSFITCQRVNAQNQQNMLLTFQDRLRIPWRGGAKRISMEAVIPGVVVPLVIGLSALNEITSYIMLGTTIVFLIYAHHFVKRNHVKTKFFFMWLIWSMVYQVMGLEFALPLLELLPEENFVLVVMACITVYLMWLTRRYSLSCQDLPSRSTEDDLADISEATAAEEEEEAAAHTALLIDNDSPRKSLHNRGSHQHQTNMCHNCRKYVSARTIHCHVCNACIMMHSHHSYWLDCCIGQYNIRYYTGSIIMAVGPQTTTEFILESKMSQIRREVIKAFKKLHRTRQLIFAGDELALKAGRGEINDRFKQNMNETNEENIKKMLQLALDVDKELRTNVIQAKQKDEGVYELRITPETTRLDNFPFNPDAIIKPPRRKGKAATTKDGETGCCGSLAPAGK